MRSPTYRSTYRLVIQPANKPYPPGVVYSQTTHAAGKEALLRAQRELPGGIPHSYREGESFDFTTYMIVRDLEPTVNEWGECCP